MNRYSSRTTGMQLLNCDSRNQGQLCYFYKYEYTIIARTARFPLCYGHYCLFWYFCLQLDGKRNAFCSVLAGNVTVNDGPIPTTWQKVLDTDYSCATVVMDYTENLHVFSTSDNSPFKVVLSGHGTYDNNFPQSFELDLGYSKSKMSLIINSTYIVYYSKVNLL